MRGRTFSQCCLAGGSKHSSTGTTRRLRTGWMMDLSVSAFATGHRPPMAPPALLLPGGRRAQLFLRVLGGPCRAHLFLRLLQKRLLHLFLARRQQVPTILAPRPPRKPRPWVGLLFKVRHRGNSSQRYQSMASFRKTPPPPPWQNLSTILAPLHQGRSPCHQKRKYLMLLG